MADASIHKPIIVKGWVISPSEGVYRAVNKYGQVGFANENAGLVKHWADTTSLQYTKKL